MFSYGVRTGLSPLNVRCCSAARKTGSAGRAGPSLPGFGGRGCCTMEDHRVAERAVAPPSPFGTLGSDRSRRERRCGRASGASARSSSHGAAPRAHRPGDTLGQFDSPLLIPPNGSAVQRGERSHASSQPEEIGSAYSGARPQRSSSHRRNGTMRSLRSATATTGTAPNLPSRLREMIAPRDWHGSRDASAQ